MSTPLGLEARPHVVYEVWMNDTCLYVGMTCDLRRRMSNHRRWNAWHTAATRMVVTDVHSRAAAESLEQQRIAELRPANNVRGVTA